MPKLKISSCTVQLLDGEDIIIEVQKLKTSTQLLDEVCKSVGIEEKIFFGLKYKHPRDNKDSWFDINKPLKRQLKNASHKFKFGVQFFPESLQSLVNEKTRYQFVLQVREYFLTGYWSCTLPTQALLASYIVQAEFGTYDREHHTASYLNDFEFAPNQPDGFLESVSRFHQKHVDFSPVDVDWLYLETARKTPLYGMELFDIMDSDGNPMKLGVSVNGAQILHLNTKLQTFAWPVVFRCRNKKNEVIVRLKWIDKTFTIGFATANANDAKRIVKCCNLYKHYTTHGERLVVKTPQKRAPVECTHNTTEEAYEDFKRVDSKRFSKRFVKESTRIHLPDDDDDDAVNDAVFNTSANQQQQQQHHVIVPTITKTAPSENSLNSSASIQEESANQNDRKDNQDTSPEPSEKEKAVSPTEREVEVIEVVDIDYKKEGDDSAYDVMDAAEQHDETTVSKIVEIEIITSTEVTVEESSNNSFDTAQEAKDEPVPNDDGDTPSYDLQTDTEVVVISGEELEDIESSFKSNRSLLEEIEKELNESYEILINSETENEADLNKTSNDDE